MDGNEENKEEEEYYSSYVQYLDQETGDTLITRSFWSGKFLQALPEDVLLMSQIYITERGAGEGHLTTDSSTEQAHSVPHQPPQQVEYREVPNPIKSTENTAPVTLSQNQRNYSKDVIFKSIGRHRLEPLWSLVMRTEECLKSIHDPAVSCSSLSPAVRRLVVESMMTDHYIPPPPLPTPPLPPPNPLDGVLTKDYTLDWTHLTLFLGTDVISERDCYDGAVKCVLLAQHVSRAIMDCAPTVTMWSGLFAWTGHQQLFDECVRHLLLMMSESDHMIHRQEMTYVNFLLCCAGLERALGDVYLTVSGASRCPSLLRDLLNTHQLQDTFGESAMCCLRCLIGPPSGLNLRNLFWHGFPSPGEISSNYLFLLLVVVASLGERLQSTAVEVVHRLPLSLEKEEAVMAGSFPELNESEVNCVERLFTESYFVPPGMLPLWLAGLSAFREQRYHHSVTLLLPCLEHGLRRVFACINHCPHRVLTAESTVLYTTFDEILSPTLPDLSPNRLLQEIGPRKIECVLDLLVQPEGPRLRDRLSHGEIDIYSISACLANHVISLLVIFCAKYTLSRSLISEPYIAKCLDVEGSYQSLFHPLSLLKRELLQLMDILETWSTIPLPPEITPPIPSQSSGNSSPLLPSMAKPPLIQEAISDLLSVEGLVDGASCSESSSSLSSSLRQVTSLCHETSVTETRQFATALRGLVESVWKKVVGEEESQSRTHWSRVGLELIGLMRRTTENLATSVCQVREMAVVRYRQQQEKQLRSRQRKNYEHLIASLPLYRAGVCLLVAMMSLTLLHLPKLTNRDKMIRLYKKVQQVSENLGSQTSATKNRWEEADRLVLSLTKLTFKDHIISNALSLTLQK